MRGRVSVVPQRVDMPPLSTTSSIEEGQQQARGSKAAGSEVSSDPDKRHLYNLSTYPEADKTKRETKLMLGGWTSNAGQATYFPD